MAEFLENEAGTPGAEPNADEGDSRRGALKRIGLATAALATATLASSKANAQAGKRTAEDDGQTLENKVIERAFTDLAFRKRLLADPRKAVAEVLGKDFPADIEVRVVQDTPKSVHLVLPDFGSVGERTTTKPNGDEGDPGKPFFSRWRCCSTGRRCTQVTKEEK